jgi:hypothetical protein
MWFEWILKSLCQKMDRQLHSYNYIAQTMGCIQLHDNKNKFMLCNHMNVIINQCFCSYVIE